MEKNNFARKFGSFKGLMLVCAFSAISSQAFAHDPRFPRDGEVRFERRQIECRGGECRVVRDDRGYGRIDRDDRYLDRDYGRVERDYGRVHRDDRYLDRDYGRIERDERYLDRDYGRVQRDERDFGRNSSDDQVKEDVNYALSDGYFMKGYEGVRGDVREGVVILIGTVSTSADREKLENKIRDIRGVRGVQNNVKVTDQRDDQDREEVVSDVQIEKNVHDALKPGIFSKGYDQVKAEVDDGDVILTGTVPTQKDKDALEKAILDIKGVGEVSNNVRVLDVEREHAGNNRGTDPRNNTRNDNPITDGQLDNQVRSALKPGLFAKGYEQVTASVSNGNVRLAGTVQTLKDKEALDKSIRDIRGVRHVQNDVRVVDETRAARI